MRGCERHNAGHCEGNGKNQAQAENALTTAGSAALSAACAGARATAEEARTSEPNGAPRWAVGGGQSTVEDRGGGARVNVSNGDAGSRTTGRPLHRPNRERESARARARSHQIQVLPGLPGDGDKERRTGVPRSTYVELGRPGHVELVHRKQRWFLQQARLVSGYAERDKRSKPGSRKSACVRGWAGCVQT